MAETIQYNSITHQKCTSMWVCTYAKVISMEGNDNYQIRANERTYGGEVCD